MQTTFKLLCLLSAAVLVETHVAASGGGCHEIVQHTHTGWSWSIFGPTPIEYERSVDALQLSMSDNVNKLTSSLDEKVDAFNRASDARRRDLEEMFRATLRQIVYATAMFERLLASANSTSVHAVRDEVRALAVKMDNFQSQMNKTSAQVDVAVSLLAWAKDSVNNGLSWRTEVSLHAILVAGFITWLICRVFLRDHKKRSKLIIEFCKLCGFYGILLAAAMWVDCSRISSDIPVIGLIINAVVTFMKSTVHELAEYTRHMFVVYRAFRLVYRAGDMLSSEAFAWFLSLAYRGAPTPSDTTNAPTVETANTTETTGETTGERPHVVSSNQSANPPAFVPSCETLVSQPGAAVSHSKPVSGESAPRPKRHAARAAPSTRQLRSQGPIVDPIAPPIVNPWALRPGEWVLPRS
jgi:hypothetical protein